MRQSRLPPTQGERREGHDLGFQRLLEPLVPLAAPFPPARRCIRKTKLGWCGWEKNNLCGWRARVARSAPQRKPPLLMRHLCLSGSLLPTRGLGALARLPQRHNQKPETFDKCRTFPPLLAPPYAPMRRRATRAGFGGGMRQSRLPPTQGERREGHDLGFQRLLEPLVPLAAPFPPLLRQDGTLSCGSPPPHARAVAIHGRRHVDAALALGCDSVTTCTRDMAAARLRTASRAAYT